MGVLYRGVDPVLDREVAIKLMLLEFSDDQAQMRARFFREARAVAKLQHRNIVTVFEFAEEHNTPYIVMEFLNGTSLASRMTSTAPLSLEERLSIMVQLCEALHYAHQQGVVHRDVKPANVFLLSDGTVKLLDFGIAKVSTSTLTRTAEVFGSVAYMSPEQVAGANTVDGRSDIFSAGVVLYELLAQRKPFESPHATATIMKILHEPPLPLDDVTGLPKPLLDVVSRALEKKQEGRFQTAGELGEALEAIRRTLGTDQASGAVEESRLATDDEIRKYEEKIYAPTILESAP